MLSELSKIKHGRYCFDYDTGEAPLKWMMFQAGFQNRQNHNYRMVRHPHRPFHYTIWQYTVRGEGTLIYDGHEYNIRPGQAMLLKNTEHHEYFLPPHSDNWEFIWINLTGHEAHVFWEHLQQSGPVHELPEDGETVTMAMQILSDAASSEQPCPFTCSEIAYRFAMSVARTIGAGKHNQCDPLIKKVRHYCLHRLNESISVDQLAAITGLSQYHFSRKFKELSGQSPGEYLTALRMDRARSLLVSGEPSVKETANLCGYYDTSYFCKAFRKQFGITPGSLLP